MIVVTQLQRHNGSHSPFFLSLSFTHFSSAGDSALYLSAQALGLCVFVHGVALPSLC